MRGAPTTLLQIATASAAPGQLRAGFEDMGGEVRGSTPEEMRARVASELQNWSKVISAAGIERQ